MKINGRRILLACAGWLVLGLHVASAAWTENLNKALAQADRNQKLVLVDFSGSDWCGWCQRLDAEVFSTPEFKKFAAQELVLVLIDFPRHKSLPKKVENANHALAKRFRVDGLPTILLLDPKGDVVARTGYKSGGAKAYIKHLSALIDKYKAKAAAAEKKEESASPAPAPLKP